MTPAPSKRLKNRRTLDARPDTLDFRDVMYQPTLVEVPERIPLARYLKLKVPILDQGRQGACTGFGLAAVAHYLLRSRQVDPDPTPVSPRMLYEMARRYDEWPGEKYEGSSARGAMKGWHKHGVCSEKAWPYRAQQGGFTSERARDAIGRPLGAYFRVNHKSLVAMHAALAEVGILYASANVHSGWDRVQPDGSIPFPGDDEGGHAFAIVAYDERGFWIQNSWGPGWGKNGFARVSYDDWLANGSDVWVARLGAPVTLRAAASAAVSHSPGARQSQAYSYADLRPHVITLGNDGVLRDSGTYGTNADECQAIFAQDFPRLTKGWKKKRLLLYAHGGLVKEDGAIQRVAEYCAQMLPLEVYPLAFVWRSDYWTTLTNMLEDARKRRRPEGFLDAAKDFLLDRADDFLEPVARQLTGKAEWDEMKENALRATTERDGGARFALRCLARLKKADPSVEIHVLGHSAGSIFHAPLVQLLTTRGPITSGPLAGARGLGLEVATCTLWAPACTVALFRQCYLPALRSGRIGRFSLFTLTDQAERDDHCANIYHKSLLYLVSNAFEERARIPLLRPDGEPILGMERFVGRDAELRSLFAQRPDDWVRAPNTAASGTPSASAARRHGDFDDDAATVQATLQRILDAPVTEPIRFGRTGSSLRDRRLQLAG